MRRAPTHPGEIFRTAFREPLNMSQAEAARQLGISKNMMNLIETEKNPVSVEMSIKFEALTGSSAEFWLTLQMRYDLWHALQEAKKIKHVIPAPARKPSPGAMNVARAAAASRS